MITTGDISRLVSPECDQKGVIRMYKDNRMIAEMEDPLFEPPREWWRDRYNGSDYLPPPETEEAEDCGQPTSPVG